MEGSFPESGPLLIVSTHRNGAVDGFLLHALCPRLEFMLKAGLVRWGGMRLFFGGIVVRRNQDSPRNDNSDAIVACEEHLLDGGALCVFPEGTSTLGPQHLPYHSGAARIALAYWRATGQLPTIIPVGLHYAEPSVFRSDVEVVIGPPLEIADPALPQQRLIALKRAISEALLSVGANFASEEHQQLAQLSARAGSSAFRRLKSMEAGPPDAVTSQWTALDSPTRDLALTAPHFPLAILMLLAAPLALPGFLLNLPILLAARLAGRRFADGPNVVALWKLIAGTVATFIWLPLAFAISALTLGWHGILLILASTVALTALWSPLRTAWRSLRFHLAPQVARQAVQRLFRLLSDV